MRSEKARAIPLPGQISIDQIGAVANHTTGPGLHFHEVGQLAAQPEKGAARHVEEFRAEELRHCVDAVAAAVRLLRWRRRRLERALAAHGQPAIDSG